MVTNYPGKNILITGRPGVGKTTLVRKIAQELGKRAGGFYTQEIRRGGERIGFRIRTLEGEKGILSRVDIHSPYRVGKYRVNLEEFERLVLPAIEGALDKSKVVIIDEIGPMELFSPKFKQTLWKALDSPQPVIATIKLKGDKFIERIKSRRDVSIFNLSLQNREEILPKILGSLFSSR